MILEIFSLDVLISFMDWTISSKLWLASATRWAVSVMRPDTVRVFSALRRVIAVISVVDEDVSSSVAACSETNQQERDPPAGCDPIGCRLSFLLNELVIDFNQLLAVLPQIDIIWL